MKDTEKDTLFVLGWSIFCVLTGYGFALLVAYANGGRLVCP